MNPVTACVAAVGSPDYLRSARQAILSLLEWTDFRVILALARGLHGRLPAIRRLEIVELPEPSAPARAYRFLAKFDAMKLCCEVSGSDLLMLFDSDALVIRPTTTGDLRQALGGRSLGMVEQTTLRGTGWGRPEFHRHYVEHTLSYLAPGSAPPPRGEFRFFNSGVVLGTREEWQRLLEWAQAKVRSTGGNHHLGKHMIADQDYFQFWTNTIQPGSCADLPWTWNHCEHWDLDFPDPRARILHFSNHCLGPGRRQPFRMALARLAARGGPATPLLWLLVRWLGVR